MSGALCECVDCECVGVFAGGVKCGCSSRCDVKVWYLLGHTFNLSSFRVIEMDQTAFEEKLRETQDSKSENAVLQPTAKRDRLIEDMMRINSHGATSPFDYNLKKRYEILRVGNVGCSVRQDDAAAARKKCNSRCHPGRACKN